jgi:hypothetical protein
LVDLNVLTSSFPVIKAMTGKQLFDGNWHGEIGGSEITELDAKCETIDPEDSTLAGTGLPGLSFLAS